MSICTIRLSNELDKEIKGLVTQGLSKSDFIRKALIEYINKEKMKRFRKQLMPYAEAQGILTDEDVFNSL